jgi:DNA repair protein RecN (Recombination protein N)
VLLELHVRDVGVIADLHLELGPGMTAVTGETGAGKTLVVEALELLVGGRGDPTIVRGGSAEALVEGRFVDGEGNELLLARAVPSSGRSRAWVDGRMAPVGALAESGRALVDLHGQHAHQSLLHQAAQRAALDDYGGIDLAGVLAAGARLREIREQLGALGGDAREHARETDLLEFQLREIESASLASLSEAEDLVAEEEALAEASALRQAAEEARRLVGDGPADGCSAVDAVAAARALTSRYSSLADIGARLAAAQAEIDDIATELRHRSERFEEDPERLAWVRARRQLLADLRRKYGDSISEVVDFAASLRSRLADLGSSEARRAELEKQREEADLELAAAEEEVGERRRAAAAPLAAEIGQHLHRLAMPAARVEVRVGEGRLGDEVEMLLGANPGEPALPLARVASGGELARAMLAARLVLTQAPDTLVFDEVDAGVGGEAALAVGAALAEIARRHQVIVVTHLAQVAAFADQQVAVTKQLEDGRTVARAALVEGEERVAELSRMLSGRAASESGRAHAAELLALRGHPAPDSAGSAKVRSRSTNLKDRSMRRRS